VCEVSCHDALGGRRRGDERKERGEVRVSGGEEERGES
jgi:hypothetical protein